MNQMHKNQFMHNCLMLKSLLPDQKVFVSLSYLTLVIRGMQKKANAAPQKQTSHFQQQMLKMHTIIK